MSFNIYYSYFAMENNTSQCTSEVQRKVGWQRRHRIFQWCYIINTANLWNSTSGLCTGIGWNFHSTEVNFQKHRYSMILGYYKNNSELESWLFKSAINFVTAFNIWRNQLIDRLVNKMRSSCNVKSMQYCLLVDFTNVLKVH